MSAPRPDRKKIAVLGGGPSSLSAVYWLTSTQALRDRYDITVYQMGWRLGGKGASGRTQDGKILEHGLHILFGFYQNFWFAMRSLYAELDRPAGHPLQTWRQAFHPRDLGVEEEFVEDQWDPWIVAFPGNGDTPGSNGALLPLRRYIAMGIQLLISLVFGWRTSYWITRHLYPRGHRWEQASEPPVSGKDPWTARIFFRLAYGLLIAATRVVQFIKRHMSWAVRFYDFLRTVFWWRIRVLVKRSRRAHRIWLDIDALHAMMRGTLADGLLLPGGFDTVDQLDFRAWLLKHGMHEMTGSTTLVRTIYDAAFSYKDGDPNNQSVAAGSTMRVMLRWFLTYKGAAFYRMQAGMGDVVFTPLYEVLKRRGVKFEFFHKVESLHLSTDKKQVDTIRVNKQVELAGGVQAYDPLVTVKGLECWPAGPKVDLIKDPAKIEGIDLEDYYTGYVGEMIDLKAGRDFDTVLFGIPIGAVRFLCKELIDNPATPAWGQMVANVKSVQTVAAQVWLNRSISNLGWQTPQPLLSLFVEPYNTWSDMSQVLPREDWPPELEPKDVGYFCGAQIGPTDPPDLDQHDFPVAMTNDAYDALVTFIRGRSHNPNDDPAVGGLATLLPGGAVSPGAPDFDCSIMVDPENRAGIERLQAQYWRSNNGPSERCTVSLPGTNQFRMKAGETGYANLFVTGDWTDNNLYLAFMEATFQSGILSARAVSGEQFPIIGEWLNGL